jgi:hypothetical protein
MNPYFDKAGYLLRAARFNARRYVRGFTINPEPAFEKEGPEFFRSVIQRSKIYLEYGSGGSTILAAQNVSKPVSVESDWIFARALKNALPRSHADIRILSPAIGFTRDWGIRFSGGPHRDASRVGSGILKRRGRFSARIFRTRFSSMAGRVLPARWKLCSISRAARS